MTISELCKMAHAQAAKSGFWEGGEKRNVGELIALIHSELSEALEALRAGDQRCSKTGLKDYHEVEIELADAVIRIADLCGGYGWNLGGAIEAKMEYNKGRPWKHGKAF